MAKARKQINRNETKPEKFARLATLRVNKLLKGLKQLGALGGTAYESTKEQREMISNVLGEAKDDAISSMNRETKASNAFKL